MNHSDPDRLPEELQPVADLLRARRPQATTLELDDVQRRVRSRASRIQKGTSMKSRLATTAMLSFGLLMSGTGAGLAVSGLSATDNAAVSQYTPVTPPPATPETPVSPPPAGGTLPETQSGGPAPAPAPAAPTSPASEEGGVQGEQEESAPAPTSEEAPPAAVQPARQVAASGSADELPFTGFAAIPVLGAGIALLGGGVVLRRRTTS